MLKSAVMAVVLAFVSLPTASGQMRGGVGSFGARPSGAHFRASMVSGSRQFSHQRGRNAFFPGGVFLGDTWLADYDSSGTPPSPSIVVIQPDAETKETAPPAPVRDPVLIELQGDRYVRYEGAVQPADLHAANAAAERVSLDSVPSAPPSGRDNALSAEPPPASLIFRDGRREEVTNYAIVGGVMYIRSDYWTSGAWSQQIQLAALDIPATLKANQDRGVKFALPSAPNEVVTRP